MSHKTRKGTGLSLLQCSKMDTNRIHITISAHVKIVHGAWDEGNLQTSDSALTPRSIPKVSSRERYSSSPIVPSPQFSQIDTEHYNDTLTHSSYLSPVREIRLIVIGPDASSMLKEFESKKVRPAKIWAKPHTLDDVNTLNNLQCFGPPEH